MTSLLNRYYINNGFVQIQEGGTYTLVGFEKERQEQSFTQILRRNSREHKIDFSILNIIVEYHPGCFQNERISPYREVGVMMGTGRFSIYSPERLHLP